MSSNIIPSKGHGLWLPAGLHVPTLQMMNHVKSIRSFTSQKIWEILGNILRVMSLILHGVQPHSLTLSRQAGMLNQESSLLTTLILKVIRKQEKDGSKVSIFITLMISLRHKRMP
jgi:hypothetical protein